MFGVQIRVLVSVAILFSFSSAVLGCSVERKNPSPIKTLQVPMDDVLKQNVITQDVTLAVGNTLEVRLASNYSTPYRWGPNTKIGDSGIIKQTSHVFEQPRSDMLGAPGTEVWTFTALKTGTTQISTGYASIVGRDAKPTCTYTVNVTVQ
jgi:inhibitor of cysteine peptidase